MPEDKSEYEKKIAKANVARNRQIERQKKKLASADYQQKLQDQQQAAQARAYEKSQACMADPDYINKQWEKKLNASHKQAKKQAEKKIEKYASQQTKAQTTQWQVNDSAPVYSNEEYNNKISQVKALQEKSLKKAALKLSKSESEKPKPSKLKALKAKPSTKPTKKSTKTKAARSSKTKGLAGRNATVIEKRLANKIGEIGCICCLNKNWYTTEMQQQESTKFISLHHIDGRTKPWAHAKVLPLCAYHHDIPAPSRAPTELTPIHRGNKKEWIEFNGTEEALLKQVYEMIDEQQPWLLEKLTTDV